MQMEPIIDAVPREELERELTSDRLLRSTNKADNLIYAVRAQDCPAVMREIGRLREIAFREAGGGTGCEVDIDESDLAPDGYVQLIVWDASAREIIGGYRYIVCDSPAQKYLSTEHYFRFSDKFRQDFLPHTIELGRSFVQPRYQRKRSIKSIYALDNLWDGLGALVVQNPEAKYFFGKVTMYANYDIQARDILIYFLQKYFPDLDHLVEPISPVVVDTDTGQMENIFTGGGYDADYRILVRELRIRGEQIPPLINSYMGLSPTMRVFSTVVNPDFGRVEETGILITIADIYPNKLDRHIKGFKLGGGLKKLLSKMSRRRQE